MTTREVTSTSAASFVSAQLDASPDKPTWEILPVSSHSTSSSTSTSTSGQQQPCCILDPNTVVRVNPMARQYGGWNDVHFHPRLRLPLECHTADGIVVTLEAMARECVAVALSPHPSFQLGKTYVVHFGAAGNVSTVIRRRLETGTEAVDVTIPSRVCSERSWISYYLVLQPSGKLYVGIGKVVGESCIGLLDDSLYHQLRPGSDAVKFVGLGNSALGRNARPLKIRHVCVTTLPLYVSHRLQALPPQDDLPLVTVEEEEDDETRALMEEYQKECQKNRARAQKFGIPYKEPSPQAFLQWSQARRLRANPEKGFITGMDITTPEELAKQEARKARFGIVTDDKKRKGSTEHEGDEQQEEQQESTAADIMEEDIEPLSLSQAWDNGEIVGQYRIDAPTAMFVNPPSEEEKREETEEFAMEESAKEAALVPEKINLFGIDWAAFKQIRTDDIMAYFSSYGPSYVEWLGELSCNVLFEDKFSAARALQHMSQELPSPPPPEVPFLMDPGNPPLQEATTAPDLGNMGWRFCLQPIRKIRNDRHGRRGTTARVLMRVANTQDVLMERPKVRAKPPPGFTTKRVLGPGSDFARQPRQKKRRRVEQDNTFDPTSGEEHPALSRGLASGREGFSVEELRRERALKAQREQQVDAEVNPTQEQV